MKNNIEEVTYSPYTIWKFLIPSIIGICLFIVPFPTDDGYKIVVSILAGWLGDTLSDVLPTIMMILIIISAVGAIIQKLGFPKALTENLVYQKLFHVSGIWFAIRIFALIFVIMVYFQIGPEWIYSDVTGGLMLYDLLPILFTVFLFAGLFLPLLLDFGLLEFVGAQLTKVMRPLFKLPGRASVDAITSWLGDGTLGVVLSSQQYESGFYTKKEASIVATTFSIVSITFTLVIMEYVNLGHMFFPAFGAITLAGFVAAIIMPRIPPLSNKPDTYINGSENKVDESIPAGYSSFKWGVKMAKDRVTNNPGVGKFFQSGIKNVLDLWFGVVPTVMAVGTIGVIIAEFTPVFTWLGTPFIPLLQFLQIPEATAAAQTFVVGFADMLLPAIFASGIESELTRFVIACTSITQLIYLSEVGSVLLGSKIPINLKDLVLIFLFRTLITLPVIALVAHLIF